MPQKTAKVARESRTEHASMSAVLIAVAAVAILINIAAILASPLWVYPDSVDYIQLAGGIADRLDFSHELFLFRTPGYPLMLAGIFALFGSDSPTAIQIVQHAMAVVTTLLTALIAWHLTTRRSVALLAGLLCAGSLQLVSYANMALAETPFTLATVACVYFLVRYTRSGAPGCLALASVLAGTACLFRPIGQHLIGVCVVAALLRAWSERRRIGKDRRQDTPTTGIEQRLPLVGPEAPDLCGVSRILPSFMSARRLVPGLAMAVAPALALTSSWTSANALAHPNTRVNRCLDYVLYGGLVTWHRLDSNTSEAMSEIRGVVEQGVRENDLPADADYRDRAIVIRAYQSVRHAPFAESSAVMGRAGRDLLFEHPLAVAVGTVKFAAWMLLAPDPVYRFQPGGAPGIDGGRNADAALLDIGTYSFGPGSWEHVLRDYRHYLPLTTEPRLLSPHWSSFARWFHRHVDQGAPLVGVGDSIFEEFMLMCLIAGGLTLFARERPGWVLVAAVIAFHISVSAFLGGPQARYAAPIKPLLLIYVAFALGNAPRLATHVASELQRSASACFGKRRLGSPDGRVDQPSPAASGPAGPDPAGMAPIGGRTVR